MVGKEAKEWYERVGVTNHYLDNIRGDLEGREFVSRNYGIKIRVMKETNCFVDYVFISTGSYDGLLHRQKKGLCGVELSIYVGDTCILAKKENK